MNFIRKGVGSMSQNILKNVQSKFASTVLQPGRRPDGRVTPAQNTPRTVQLKANCLPEDNGSISVHIYCPR